MAVCAIATCKNNSRKTGRDVSYHTFPKDFKLRKRWILQCRRHYPFKADNSRICSVHFKDTDYERNLKAELLGYVPHKKVLKKDVYPTLNLPGSLTTSTSFKIISQTAATVFLPVDNSPVCNTASCPNVATLQECMPGNTSRQSRAKKQGVLKLACNTRQSRAEKQNVLKRKCNTGQSRAKKRDVLDRTFNTIENLSPEKHKFNKGTNTDVHDCSRCFEFQNENQICMLKVKKLLMNSKARECKMEVMKGKLSKLKKENTQLKKLLGELLT